MADRSLPTTTPSRSTNAPAFAEVREGDDLAQITAERTARPPKPADRLANVERLRILAMFEIVWFHDTLGGRVPLFGGLGLPTFLILNNIFNCTLTERRGFKAFLRLKVERLLLPWIAWNVIYGSLLAWGGLRRGIPLGEVFSFRMILAGTYSHLWFVPFAIFSGLLVASAQSATRRWPAAPTMYGAALIGAAIVAAVATFPDRNTWGAPIPQWLLSFASPFFGFALGRALLQWPSPNLRRAILPLGAAATLVWVCSLAFHLDFLVFRYAASLLLVVLALSWPGKADPLSKHVAPLLFGIYLAHHLVERALHATPLAHQTALLVIADSACTALLVWGLKKVPVLQRLV